MAVADRIRSERRRQGFTQEALARRAGLTLNGYADIERGIARDPHISSLTSIARALGLTLAELLEEPVAAGKAEAPQAGHGEAEELAQADPDVKGPDPEEWDPDEERPKWEPPLSHGKDIGVLIGGDDEVTITERSFLEVVRALKRGEITPEEAWQRVKRESA